MISKNLLVRLCRSLAIHCVETELTLQHMEGPKDALDGMVRLIQEARSLISEAGFEFDELYPPSQRPTAVETP